MPQLTQIACSTVLRMQIHFAWKSIWSCLKESRTALLLSPLTGSRGAPSRRLSPLVWKTSSPALHAWARGPRQSVAEPKTPWANMQISEACTDGPVYKQHGEPCNCVLTQSTHAIQAHGGNNQPLCGVSRPLRLQPSLVDGPHKISASALYV